MSKQYIGLISLVVKEYDEAIEFYTHKLRFSLVEDTYIPEQDKRWVVVRPPGGENGASLLLARASTEEQKKAIGNQTGGRVFLFLYTTDVWADHKRMTELGIKFVREPKQAPHGIVGVFEDLYGNTWDLIQLNQ